MRQPPRIAQVLLSPRIGGAEQLADSLRREWQTAGVDSRIVYLDPDGAQRGKLQRIRRLRRALVDYRPDAVVAHSALPNLYARVAAPRRLPVVCVLHSAGDDFADRGLRVAERVVARRAFRVVAVSAPQLQGYLRRFPELAARSMVIPNGIADDLPSKIISSPRPTTAITVARLVHQKNPRLWVDVAEALHSAGSDLQLHWWGPTGDGSSQAELSRVAQLGSARFHGPTDDVPSVLMESDLLFHTADREAHSVALLEAAAVGLPIVCSDAVAATLPPGLAYGQFEVGDAQDAVRQLEMVMRQWDDATRHASKARELVRSTYSMANCAAAYLELLDLPATTRRAGGR